MNAKETIVRRMATARQKAWRVVQTASTSQKLALAFALFLIPLIFVGSKLADEQQRLVDVARQERDGGAYLRVINEAHALLNMQSRAQQLGHDDVDNISAAIRALRSAERRYGEGLQTAELSERSITAMRTVLNNDRARATAAGAAVMALCDLAHQVGDRAHLVRDPERTSHYAAAIVLERAPMLAQQARDLASLTEQVFADRRVGEGERTQVLQELALLERASNSLSNAMDAMTDSAPDATLSTTLGPPSYAVITNFAAYRGHIERALDRGRLDLRELVATEAGAQFALADLSERISTSLDGMLLARANRLANDRTGTLMLAACLFIVVLGFVVALLRVGLVQPIDSLSASIRAIADGNYDSDIPALNRGDEIGDMARALAVLRDAAEARIAAETARAVAEGANRAKSQFVANMSHELRTPLNAIIGYAEILAEDSEDRGDASAIADLQRINMAARHLLAVINDILDLSKIEAGRMDVLAAPSDPRGIVAEAASTAQLLASKNGNTLDCDIEQIGESYVDAQKLRQCLLNLLSNACKFTRNGSVSLSMRRMEQAGEARLVFTVADTGIGLSSEQMTRLFQAFEQASANTAREFGGTGLGLMITRRMAQMMGGDVSVSSELGKGATFTLWVPQFYQGYGDSGNEDVFDREGAEDAPLAIVIDDEASARDLAIRALTQVGFAVQCARTAEAGLTLARSLKPSLVILDINLPDRDGWQVISDLALDPETRSIPIVVLSIEEDRRRSIELGAAEHLVKPATRDTLCAAALRLARIRPMPLRAAVVPVRLTA